MAEKQKSRDAQSQQPDNYLSDFMNKVVVCETLSGKTITGVLAGYDRFNILLIETKDIKSTNPMKTMIYKHGVVSIRETE